MKLSNVATSAMILFTSAAAALAQDGHDAHGHDTHAPGAAHEVVGAIPTVKQGIATGVTALIVFALVAAFLGIVVWPKIAKGLDDRASKIREEIAAAEAARKQAKDALDQYEKSLSEARAEAAKMLDHTRRQQQLLAEELKAKADADLSAMKDRARREIEAAKRAAVSEIFAASAQAATSIAGKILQREITPRDQQRLIEETVGELAHAAGQA